MVIVADIAINIKYLLFLQLLKTSKNRDDKKIATREGKPPDKNATPEPIPRTMLALNGLLKYNEKAYKLIV